MGLYDDDPDRPAPTTPAPVGAAPAGAPARVDYGDDPDLPASKPGRAGDRTRELIKEQSKMSWPAWLGQSAMDAGVAAGHVGSFGLDTRRNALSGWIAGDYPSYSAGVEAEQEKSRRLQERSPIATLGGNVGGAVGGGAVGAAPRVGANIAGRLGAGPLARAVGFGAEAGGIGAAQAAGQTYTGNPEDYMSAAMWGGGTGAALGGAAGAALVPKSAVQMRAGDPRTGQPIRQPTNEELLARSDNGYKTLAKIPVTYPGSHLQGQLSAAESQMITQNVAPEQAKTVFAMLERMRKHPGSISPAQIDGWRQSLNNMKNVPTPGAEKAGVAAAILRDSLDDMIQNGAKAASNPVLAQQAARWVEQARGDRAAMFRSQQLTDPAANAARKAETGGPPVGEQLVAKGNKLLETKRGQQPNTRGWIDEERARVAAAITPTATERIAGGFADLPLKTIGAGIGGSLGGGGGAVAGNIPGAVGGGAVGAGAGAVIGGGAQRLARGFAARGIEGRWNDAAAAMRGRSPSYERALQGAVPVAGPGMGPKLQGMVNAGTGQLGVPYDVGRDALVPSMMQQFGFY